MRTLILLGIFAWGLLAGGERSAPLRATAERRADEPAAATLQTTINAEEAPISNAAAIRISRDKMAAWRDIASSPSLVRKVQESVRIQSVPAPPQGRGGYKPRIATVTSNPEYRPKILMTEPWKPGDGKLRAYLGPRDHAQPKKVYEIPDLARPAPRSGSAPKTR